MRILLLTFFLLFLAASCETAEYNPESQTYEACGVKDPVKNLAWLNQQVEEFRSNTPASSTCAMSVFQATYQGQTVFIVDVGGALCCVCGVSVYSCEGKVINNCVILDDSYTERKTIGTFKPY